MSAVDSPEGILPQPGRRQEVPSAVHRVQPAGMSRDRTRRGGDDVPDGFHRQNSLKLLPCRAAFDWTTVLQSSSIAIDERQQRADAQCNLFPRRFRAEQ